MRSYIKRRRAAKDRGAAIVEFAIAIPIFVALLLLVFDAGLGYSASRTSSSAARSAARVGALAGEARNADFRVLDALRAQFGGPRADGDDGSVARIVVYRSDPGNPNGAPPTGCISASIPDVCNSYPSTILESLTPETFATEVTIMVPDPDTGLPTPVTTCDPGAPDAAWCPLDRRADEGSFLGVYIASVYDTTTGIESTAFNLQDRAVFAMYFPPLPEALEPAAP